MAATNHDTENGSKDSESTPQGAEDTEPTYTLQGLSEDDRDLLIQALYALNNNAIRGETYERTSDMIDRLYSM